MIRRTERSWKAELWQNGIRVAGVDCPTAEDMRREIGHYAMMYGQDGPVRIVENPHNPKESQ